MKSKLFLLLLILITTDVYAEWELYNMTQDKKTYLYYDNKSVKKNGSLIKVMELLNYAEVKSTAADGHLSIKVLKQFDCKKEKEKILSMTVYDNHMGTGNIIKKIVSKPGDWKFVPANSISRTMFNKLCRGGSSAYAGLTGEVRDNFIGSFNSSCIQNQLADKGNSGVSRSILMLYCSCAGNYVADRLNNKDIQFLERGDTMTPTLNKLLQQGATYCAPTGHKTGA